ncbi:Uncharacterised protein [Gordonia bronchialis]|nr:Uncharacterised protein [Gordonia bronchialis]
MQGPPAHSRYTKQADDEAFRDRLWSLSEELTGVSFGL